MIDLRDLVEQYPATIYRVVRTGAGYDQATGIWHPGTEREVLVSRPCAVLPLSSTDLRFAEAGTYTMTDRKLYCYERLELGARVKHDGLEYAVHAEQAYLYAAGLRVYVIKRVGESGA